MQNYLLTRRYFITGSQRPSNFFWAFFISLGAVGFLVTGFVSFLNSSLFLGDIPVDHGFALQNLSMESQGGFVQEGFELDVSNISKITSISFFPQGLIMCFYGSLGLIFGLYLWLTILWRVGSGFNEFNKNTGVVRIFRWGLPGKNRQIDFQYKIKDIEALRVSLKEGLNPRRTIALRLKGKGEIAFTRIGEPIALSDIEDQASSLARFLKVEIEVDG